MPEELREFNTVAIDKIRDVLRPEQDAKLKELAHYNASIEGMIDNVSEYEEGIREEFQDVVDESAETRKLLKKLLEFSSVLSRRIKVELSYVRNSSRNTATTNHRCTGSNRYSIVHF